MTKTVLAVDVGYGNVKAVWGAECNPNSEIIFRSISIPVHKGTDINTSKGQVVDFHLELTPSLHPNLTPPKAV